jgi:hypothetical protein
VTAEVESRAEHLGLAGDLAQLLLAARIVDHDLRALIDQQTHDREAATTESYYRDESTCESHVHLNFSVARLASASMMAMIQKRTMMRGSGQPFFS